MIKINQNYINRFKCSTTQWLYYVSPGCFLAFDKDTFEFIGIELFYLPANYDLISKKCDDKIQYLLGMDILIYEND